jgi:hypothetical protein
MRRIRRVRLVPLLFVLGLVRPLGAQTVRPAVIEYSGQARGKFDLVNETLFPMTVVLEARGFHVEPDGSLIEEPLDTARMQVKLSAMSFRIPPRETYTVFYQASAKSFPAWFLVSSVLSGARTQTGLNVRIELPHVVYMLQPAPLRRADVTLRAFEFDSVAKRVHIELENTSPSLGRVLSSEVSVDGKKPVPGGAFPLFPQSHRSLEIPWSDDTTPEKLVLRFANFTLEERRKGAN